MSAIERHRRLCRYEFWANDALLASMERAGGSCPADAVRLFGHVVGTLRLWLARIEGSASPLAVWPPLALGECRSALAAAEAAWRDYLSRLGEPEQHRVIPYRNSKGESFESRVDDILEHVFLHSAYHRGQIASRLVAAGLTPAYTDYIHARRTDQVH